MPLLPAAAMLELAVAAASTAMGGAASGTSPWCVSGLSIISPIVMPDPPGSGPGSGFASGSTAGVSNDASDVALKDPEGVGQGRQGGAGGAAQQLLVTCRVELGSGQLRISYSSGASAARVASDGQGEGETLVATGRVARVQADAPPPVPPADTQEAEGQVGQGQLIQGQGQAPQGVREVAAARPGAVTARRTRLAAALGIAALAAQRVWAADGADDSPAVPSLGMLAAAPPSGGAAADASGPAGGTAGSAYPGGGGGGAEGAYASGFLSFPGHLDSALHLGVAQPGSGAKVPVAAAAFLVGASLGAGVSMGSPLQLCGGDDRSAFAAGGGMWAVGGHELGPAGRASGGMAGAAGGAGRQQAGRAGRGCSSFRLVSGCGGAPQALLHSLETVVAQPGTLRASLAGKAAATVAATKGAAAGSGAAMPLAAGAAAATPGGGQGSGKEDEEEQGVAYAVDWLVDEPAHIAGHAPEAATRHADNNSSGSAVAVARLGFPSAAHPSGSFLPELAISGGPGKSVAAGSGCAPSVWAAAAALQALQATRPYADTLEASLIGSSGTDQSADVRGMGASLAAAAGSAAAAAVDPVASSLWGVLRTAATENANSRWGLTIRAAAAAAADPVFPPGSLAAPRPVARGGEDPSAVAAASAAQEVKGHLRSLAHLGGTVAVPRLVPCPHAEGGQWVQLRPRPRGSLQSLLPERVGLDQAAAALRPGEALVAVSAVGINFRDVLNVSR